MNFFSDLTIFNNQAAEKITGFSLEVTSQAASEHN